MKAEKQIWLLTGGNGAGKSTFFRIYLAPRGLQLVSVDETARLLEPRDPASAIFDAQQWVDKKRIRLLEEGASFVYETVFSHPSKVDFVAEAKARGFEITLVYIHLATPELNQARVKQRVSEGGHDVPPEKITSRIPRTMKYVGAAIILADHVRLMDNSSYAEPFKIIAGLNNGVLLKHVEPLPEWAIKILDGQGRSKINLRS
jgi:predicted ABC-type ATPase